MKLVRFYKEAGICQGVLTKDEQLNDVSHFGEDWNSQFFESDGIARLREWLESQHNLDVIPFESVTLAPAVERPPNIHCIGLNYADHVKEFLREGKEADLPEEPVLFNKSTASWSAPNGNIIIPADSDHTDWEVELAIVIKTHAKNVSAKSALDYIAGFGVMNDYSERHWQKELGGQWVKGKSSDTFAPFGPYLATPDEINDPHQLSIWLKLNGETMQDGNTNQFLFDLPYIISYLSRFTTLLPGDVISTGTPSGVGLGQSPPRFLRDGDVVEFGIDGLGSQRQVAVKEKAKN